MIDRAKQAWDWFVGGLTDAVLWLIERFSGTATYRIVVSSGAGAIEAPDGSRLGHLVERDGTAHLEPAGIGDRLKGARIDIVVPPAWLFRRDLDPVAVQSVPFLDAFVRHQIERITPWRVGDVHYLVRQCAIAGDPTRVSVAVDVVPRRLVAASVATVERLHPRQFRIRSQADGGPDQSAITLGSGASRMAAAARQRILLGLGILALCLLGSLGWLSWQASAVRDDIAEQDRVLEERRAVLARASKQARGSADFDRTLRDLRDARPRAVDIIEALARALPDTAHLTDLTLQRSQMTVIGISTDTSLLVPALESSGHFADVAFGASTTKDENGHGDRFQLDMRIRDPVPRDVPAATP